jgi:hypothetical protein
LNKLFYDFFNAEKSELDELISSLKQKRENYKEIALSGKREGNKSLALAGLHGVKQCDQLLLDASNGKPISLDELPTVNVDGKSKEEQSVQVIQPFFILIKSALADLFFGKIPL